MLTEPRPNCCQAHGTRWMHSSILPSQATMHDADEGSDWRSTPFSVLKTDPGRVSLKSVLRELEKLRQIEALELPDTLFAEIQPKILRQYRLRAAAEPPREVRLHPEPMRYTLLAAFCWQRRQEIIDGLVDLLIQIVHRISVRAEKKVVEELVGDLQKVHGKTTLLFKMAEAALEQPRGCRQGGPLSGCERADAVGLGQRISGAWSHLPASCLYHLTRLVQRALPAYAPASAGCLGVSGQHGTHRPIIPALAFIKAHRDSRKQHFVVDGTVPIEGVIPPHWRELVMEPDASGEIRVNRINYEISALHSLREGLRCKAIWVVGADRFRNPDEDLPADFDMQRTTYYAALQQPESAEDFIAGVRHAMEEALARFNDGLPRNPKVTLRTQGKNRIKLSPLDPQPEPANMLRLKAELMSRWPMTSLLDVLKETDLRVGFSDAFHSVASREMLDRTTLQPRLLRCLYGLGTNTGLKRVIAGDPVFTLSRSPLHSTAIYPQRRVAGGHRPRRQCHLCHPTPGDLGGGHHVVCLGCQKVRRVGSESHDRMAHPVRWPRGDDLLACGEKIGLYLLPTQALFVLGGGRHDGRGPAALHRAWRSNSTTWIVMGKARSPSRLAICWASISCRVSKPSPRKSFPGPNPGNAEAYPNLQPILTQPINWALIRQQYDEMIKYTTALRLGTAEPESILRRFTRTKVQHPTYRALVELGKAIKTTFLARYLHEEALRREINAGLNVVENWNSANGFIFYGKSGEIATNRLDDQELSVLSLHLLQACLVYINTLMLQDILADPAWMGRMTADDFRALSPLVYTHINPYGTFELDMDGTVAACGLSWGGVCHRLT